MKLLDQFISRTGRQPADWTSQDIQRYLNYRSALVAAGTGPKKNERLLQKTDFRHPVQSLRASSEESKGYSGQLEARNFSQRSQ
jgi:hypothetical protein